MSKKSEKTEKIFIGKFMLNDKLDITDPCYNKNVWCRMTTDCMPGEYFAYATLQNCGEWGTRVAALAIYRNGEVVPKSRLTNCLGEVGVDAGLAGFFREKPDYDDDAWNEFCNAIGNKKYLMMDYGVVSESGYGDGSYKVYTNQKRTAFLLRFL